MTKINRLMQKWAVLILLTFLLPNMKVNGQTLDIPKAVPVSPNAATFGQFGTFPTGCYTGVPNISVPLYEIDLDGRKIPIALSYNASGVKVAQEGSCVGLGWSLVAGGTITKEIRGWNDFYKNSQTYPDQTIPNDPGYYYNNWPAWPIPDANNNLTPTSDDTQDVMVKILTAYDTQPDLFHFNFGGYSGTLFFDRKPGDKNKTVKPYILTPSMYLDVNYNVDESSWSITDPLGYKFTFLDKEWTEPHTASSKTYRSDYDTDKLLLERRKKMPYIETCWVLNSIESPKGNKVLFSYTAEIISTPIMLTEPLLMSVPIVNNFYVGDGVMRSYDYSFSYITQQTLSKIEFDKGTITFVKSNREDLDSTVPSVIVRPGGSANAVQPQRIDVMSVKDRSGVEVKKLNFGYDYMGDTSDYTKCRLMLKSLTETDGNNNSRSYKFSYVGGVLPAKNTQTTDIWGYCNTLQEVDHTQTLPQMIYSSRDSQGNQNVIITNGKECNPNSDYAQYGTLESIEYPTGGKTKYIYDIHHFSESFKCGVIQTNTGWGTVYHDPTNPAHSKSREIIGDEFSIADKTSLRMKYHYHSTQYGNPSIISYSVTIRLERKLSANQFEVVKRYYMNMDKGADEKEEFIPINSGGVFRIVIEKDSNQFNSGEKSCDFYILIQAQGSSTVTPRYISSGGGLRIKEIQNIEGEQIIMRKKYVYEKNGQPTGHLLVTPDCANMGLFGPEYNQNVAELATVAMLSINNKAYGYVTPYVTVNGINANIGYSYVEEYLEDTQGKTAGKTTYTYFNERENKHILLPGLPHQLHPGNGSLLQQCEYDAIGNLVRKIERTYAKKTVIDANNVKGLVLHEIPDVPRIGGKFYDMKSERWTLDKEVVTDYYNNEKESVVTTRNYQYHPQYWMMNKEIFTDSRSRNLETRIKYPVDYIDGVSTAMKSKNMVSIPIETLHLNDGKVISGQKLLYADFQGMFLPKEVYELEVTAPLADNSYSPYFKQIRTFDKYDSKGNLLQQKDKDNVFITYLWSYGNKYPVAFIRNADYESVQTAANAIGINIATLAASLAPDMAKVNQLRDKLPQAEVITYTYKPLVGITSVTAPNNMKTTYEYDKLGRLTKIKDHEGKIVEQYDYHYKP